MSRHTVTLDGSKLKQVGTSSHTAGAVLLSLAIRDRLRHSVNLAKIKDDLVRSGEKIVDSEYKQTWKDLQDLGMGSLVYGRGGNPDRFDFHRDLRAVGKAAVEGTDTQSVDLAASIAPAPRIGQGKKRRASDKVTWHNSPKHKVEKFPVMSNAMAIFAKKKEKEKQGELEIEEVKPTVIGSKLIYIPLRKGFNLEINLPADLSSDEMDIITGALGRCKN